MNQAMLFIGHYFECLIIQSLLLKLINNCINYQEIFALLKTIFKLYFDDNYIFCLPDVSRDICKIHPVCLNSTCTCIFAYWYVLL